MDYNNPRVPLEELIKEIDSQEAYVLELEERNISWDNKLKSYQFVITYFKAKWRLAKLRQFLHSRLHAKYYNMSRDCLRILEEIRKSR